MSAKLKLKEPQDALVIAEAEVLYKEFKKFLNNTASRNQAERSSARVWMWDFDAKHGRELGNKFMRRANIEDGLPEDEGINK